ncbi:MAG: hypothetical protein A4E61_01477 [Syntrophorhabdus sp. PtaB.Bin184]|nr:MAG: hypothetical protein A4E61_01477 [Syntrophorhabdus sp. PtaB.Bin184]
MSMTREDAREMIEDVFDFDHVGDAMTALRRDLGSSAAKEELVDRLTKCALEEGDDVSGETRAVLLDAARERVERFIKGASYSQSGCSKS